MPLITATKLLNRRCRAGVIGRRFYWMRRKELMLVSLSLARRIDVSLLSSSLGATRQGFLSSPRCLYLSHTEFLSLQTP